MRRIRQGRFGLPVTYWLLGVGGNMTFVAILVALWLWLGRSSLGWLWAVYVLSLAWFVLIFAGIHRAAARYAGPVAWARLARTGVCIGIPRMAGEAVLLGWLTWA